MANIFQSPFKYVQGEGLLRDLYKYIEHFGDRGLVIASNSALEQWENHLREGMTCNKPVIENFGNRECTEKEINRLISLSNQENINFVIGFGGGKAQDTAKALAYKLGCMPLAIIPTIASCDAPTSALSIIYTEEGSFQDLWRYHQNPHLVLVDTEIIANAPSRYLVAGMGDGLATKFEAEACVKSGNLAGTGGYATELAQAAASLCYKIIIDYGMTAKQSVISNLVTPALEKVVEANILLSGLGFENNGVASTHGIAHGFSVIHDSKPYLHGEKVAFSTLVQLVLEGQQPKVFTELASFCRLVGLPITLAELGITSDKSDKVELLSKAVNFKIASNHPFKVTPHKVYNAVMLADSMGIDIHNNK